MEDRGKSVVSAFHDLSLQDEELINCEESTKPDGKRAFSYSTRPGMPDCMYLLRNGSCHFKWQCMFNHPTTRTESQVTSKTNTSNPKYSGRTQLPKKRERPCPPSLLYGANNSGSKSKYRIPNCIAVAGSNLVYGYGNHEPLPSHPWGTPQHAWASMSLPFSVGSLPNIFSSPCYATLKHSPPVTATSSQTDHPMEEADDSTGIQQKILTEGSVQVSCPFPKSYEKCWYNSRCRQTHSESSVPSCALNDGERRCTSYNLWGLCKFGPSCKFDHSPIDDPSALPS